MSKHKGIEESLLRVEEQLAGMGKDLDELSRALWQNIDHDDPAALDDGVRFKQRFNENRGVLEAAVAQMLALLRDYPLDGPGRGTDESLGEIDERPLQEPAPVAKPIEPGLAPVSLGDLTNRLPFGFELNGKTYTCATAWPLFYEALLEELYETSAERLSGLAEYPSRFTYNGKILFARLPDKLDDPLPVADALFAEVDLDPEDLIEVIRRLLPKVGFSTKMFKILVKEKNRGTVETLSIAA